MTEEQVIDTVVEVPQETQAIFAPAGEYKKIVDVSEALRISNDLRLTEVECKLGDIQLDSSMKIHLAGTERKMTQKGFEGFCRVLNLPKRFALAIPDDLLLDNVRRLISNSATSDISVIIRPSGDIVNFLRDSKVQDSQSFDVLSSINSSFGERIKYVDINDSFMKICITYSDSIKISDRESLYISNFITNYPAGGGEGEVLTSSNGLYRTECENSFVMSVLGKIRARSNSDKDQRLSKFLEHLGVCDSIILSSMKTRSSRILNSQFFDFELRNLWKAIQPVLGSVIADRITKIDNESARKFLFSSIDLRNLSNKQARLTGGCIEEPALMSLNSYDILNDLTLHAHTHFAGEVRYKLETIAGKFLSDILLN